MFKSSFLRAILIGLVIVLSISSITYIPANAALVSPEPPPPTRLIVQSPPNEFLHLSFPSQTLRLQTSKPAAMLPDLDLRYIERSPSYPYDGAKKWPAPGDPVTFTGYIANRGQAASGPFEYRWRLDGIDQPIQTHPGLAPSAEGQLSLPWSWQGGVHTICLELDPAGAIAEFSESNNQIEDRTNALELGIYVEQSVVDFFNQNVWQAGWGGNSFDNWLQRQVAVWNGIFASAVHPLTPQGIIDRVRLGKVVRVPDGGIHCSTNFPADDRELDLIWGFLSESVGVASNPGCPGWTAYYKDNPGTWDVDRGLLHELTHARYLIDLYGMNIDAHTNSLTAGIGAADTTVPLTDLPDIPEYAIPFDLIIDGEILVCQEKSGLNATNCQRGQYGTSARAHALGADALADKILLTDGEGNALAGGAAMPVVNYSFFYLEPYFYEDMMDSGTGYGEHSAYAWNRIAGQRPVCGNANAPSNLGEYLVEMPAENILEIRWPDGSPAAGAWVEVYRSKPFPIWYGTSYESTPDMTLLADGYGRANLGSQPFGATIVHTFGHSNTILLLKVIGQGKLGAIYWDITAANIAYWSGNHSTATYPIVIQNYIPSDLHPTQIYLPAVFRS